MEPAESKADHAEPSTPDLAEPKLGATHHDRILERESGDTGGAPDAIGRCMSGKPIYIVAPEGSLRDRCVALLPCARVLERGLDLQALDSAVPGVVLVEPRGIGAGELTHAATALRPEDGWRICTVEERGGDPVEVRTVSLGVGHTTQDVLRFAAEQGGAGCLLELHGVLTEVARARHDLNNPLTSALAEVQILLMDAAGGPEEESLLTIQEQLRRLRDRLLATRHLRPAPARP